jgi:hypothetical protein
MINGALLLLETNSFHFFQCIWRKTQKCGLQTYYKENNDITRLVRRAAVLPLVTQHIVVATGRWFSPGSPVSPTNKTDSHDKTEILLKVALSTIKQTNKQTS